MYILGLWSSWGTLRICPAWSPSEHQLALALSPFGGPASVWSRAIRRRLFIVLMTAAHISPNVFSLWNFLSNIHGLFLTVQATSFILIIHHNYTHIYIFYFTCLVHIFTSLDLHGRLAALGSLCPIQLWIIPFWMTKHPPPPKKKKVIFTQPFSKATFNFVPFFCVFFLFQANFLPFQKGYISFFKPVNWSTLKQIQEKAFPEIILSHLLTMETYMTHCPY